jgi:hypothetical protein
MSIDFYCNRATNIDGDSYQDLLKFSDYQLEDSHTAFGWLFPLTEATSLSSKHPVLTKSDVNRLLDDADAMHNFRDAYRAVIRYFNNPNWVYGQHNHLRITRVIRCFRIFGMYWQADAVYKLAKKFYEKYPTEIGTRTLEFWDRAIKS